MKGQKLTHKDRLKKTEENPIERAKMFKRLCAHIVAGYSVDCFPEISDELIYTWMKKYPLEFVESDFEEAKRRAKIGWEDIGRKQSEGKCLGNSRSWFYNMAHRYKWSERVHVEADVKAQVSVNVINYASLKPSADTPQQ